MTTSAPASASASAGKTAAPLSQRTKLTPLVSDGFHTEGQLDLGKEGTLYVGSSGQRWLVTTTKDPLPDDPDHERVVVTGGPMAGETLVAARRSAEGFLFVGESGATYAAKTPLGELTPLRAPPEPVRAIAVGRDAILAITRTDALLRSTDGGVSFQRVALPVGAAIPVSLAASARGEALLLAAPGKILASFDDAASFAPLATDGLGAHHVVADASGALWARGYATSPTKPPGLAAITTIATTLEGAALRPSKSALHLPQRPIDDADRLELGDGVRDDRAVFTDAGYLELRSDDGELLHAVTLEKGASGAWTIAHHPRIKGTRDCEGAVVAAAGSLVEGACVRVQETPKGTRATLQLLRSADFGRTFTLDGTLEAGSGPRRLFVTPGAVFVDGACVAPYQASCGEDGLLVRLAGDKSFAPAKMPRGQHVQALRAAGERVYVAAQSDEPRELALLVSRDGGRTFARRPLPKEDGVLDPEIAELAVDGSAVRVFLRGEPYTAYETRDDGQTWERRDLSFTADWLSIAGAHGLATSGQRPGVGFETFDGGRTWGEVPLPRTPGVGGTLPVACSESACMLGDVAIREGWELASAAEVKPITTPSAKPPAHLPLLECTAGAAELALGAVVSPQVAPSPALLFATLARQTDGAVEVVAYPRVGPLTRTSLLAAPAQPAATRNVMTPEGMMVVRVPRSGGVVSAEVAWWIAATGKVHRATLPGATTAVGTWGSPSGVLGFAPGYGAYVRLATEQNNTLHLIREGGAVSKMPLPSGFPALANVVAHRSAGRTWFVGAATPSGFGERALIFASLPDSGPLTTHAWSLFPRTADARALDVRLSHSSAVVGWSGSDTIAPHAWYLSWSDPSRDPPDAIALPAPSDTCGKSAAPRVELPWARGKRTPIVIKHGTRVLYHATTTTVARVAAKNTCVAGQLAGPPMSTGASEWTILDDSGARGVLVTTKGKTHVAVELTCAPSSAPLPAAFVGARGF